jgi:hypothetical protein
MVTPQLVACTNPLNHSIAFLDTVEVFFQYLSDRQRFYLERLGRLKECRDCNTNRLFGYRLILNLPSKQTLLHADRLSKLYRGVISRFDLAIDHTPDGITLTNLKDKILRQVWLRWRRRAPMGHDGETNYWVGLISKAKRRTRNLVLYADKPSKITGEPCVHLELRFYNSDTIRRQGIRSIRALITINPKALLDKHVAWSDVTNAADRYVLKVTRRAVQEDRERYCGRETSTFVDRYRASIKYRVPGLLLDKLHLDRAQIIKHHLPTRKLPAVMPVIAVPMKLSWSS